MAFPYGNFLNAVISRRRENGEAHFFPILVCRTIPAPIIVDEGVGRISMRLGLTAIWPAGMAYSSARRVCVGI